VQEEPRTAVILNAADSFPTFEKTHPAGTWMAAGILMNAHPSKRGHKTAILTRILAQGIILIRVAV
jgi:hypothetical protein